MENTDQSAIFSHTVRIQPFHPSTPAYTSLKKNTEWMSPVSTITLITENSFWQNAGKKQKAREVSNAFTCVQLFYSLTPDQQLRLWNLKGKCEGGYVKADCLQMELQVASVFFCCCFCKHPLGV